MDSIFCKKCLHGNPAYLQYCTNCNEDLLSQADSDLFAPIDGESAPQPQPEISAEMLERKAKNAKVLSFVTTIFKIWFLYSLETEAHRSFPSISDVLLVISPMIVAAISARKSKRWYWILLADSFVMILVFVVVLFIFIAATLSKKGL